MNEWIALLILLGVSLLVTTIGFKKYVYFLSIGYGLAVAFCGLTMGIIFLVCKNLTIVGLIASVLFIVYGLRLSLFLLIREIKNAIYRDTLKEATKTSKPIPAFVLVFMWIMVAILYVMQVSGVVFASFNRPFVDFFDFDVIQIIGLVIMLLAIIIEAVADKQKSNEKKLNPRKAAMHGLYKICRCPNYYGEILFWTGVVVYSCTYLKDVWAWIIVVLAYILIVYIMLNGAKRLEKRQAESYKNDEEFQSYIKKTPLIFYLFIPIKSLKNSKVIK